MASNPYGAKSMFHMTAASPSNTRLQTAFRARLDESELRNMRQTFDAFDEDKSESINQYELKEVMNAMGHAMTDEQILQLVEQVDTNHSGDLCFEEFTQLISLWKAASQFKLFDANAPSIQAARINDAIQPQGFTLLMDSWARFSWDCVLAVAISYSFFMRTLLLSSLAAGTNVYSTLYDPTLTPDIVVSVIYLIDIVVQFFTAVPESSDPHPGDRRLAESVGEIAKRYCTSLWFPIDIIAVFPIQRFSTDPIAQIVALITLVKALKLFVLWGRSRRMQLTPTYVYVHYYIIPLTRVLLSFTIFVHSLAVLWTFVAVWTSDEQPELTSTQKTQQVERSYINSLYFVLYTLTTCGFGDVVILGSDVRIIVACIFCFCGTLMNGLVIGSIVSILSKTDIQTERENKLTQTLAVCRYFSVPDDLAEEILNFQDHLLLHNLGDSHKDLIRGLPHDMRLNISLFSKLNLIAEVPLFKDAHQGTKVALAEQLVSEVFRPEENVIVYGDLGTSMYYISYGFVDVNTKNGASLAILRRGDHFGETALLATNSRRSASVKAITYCDLLRLDRETFYQTLKRFPKFKADIMKESMERQNKLKEMIKNDPESPKHMAKTTFFHEIERTATMRQMETERRDHSRKDLVQRCGSLIRDFSNVLDLYTTNHPASSVATRKKVIGAIQSFGKEGSFRGRGSALNLKSREGRSQVTVPPISIPSQDDNLEEEDDEPCGADLEPGPSPIVVRPATAFVPSQEMLVEESP